MLMQVALIKWKEGLVGEGRGFEKTMRENMIKSYLYEIVKV